jgi:tRNA(fMet)-specific endonuclease VapC
MKYLLDTNVCVRYLNGESEVLRRRLQSTNLEDIAVCSIVKMELFYGAMRSNDPDASWRKQQKFLREHPNFAKKTVVGASCSLLYY